MEDYADVKKGDMLVIPRGRRIAEHEVG